MSNLVGNLVQRTTRMIEQMNEVRKSAPRPSQSNHFSAFAISRVKDDAFVRGSSVALSVLRTIFLEKTIVLFALLPTRNHLALATSQYRFDLPSLSENNSIRIRPLLLFDGWQ